jgi:hypothetical protein
MCTGEHTFLSNCLKKTSIGLILSSCSLSRQKDMWIEMPFAYLLVRIMIRCNKVETLVFIFREVITVFANNKVILKVSSILISLSTLVSSKVHLFIAVLLLPNVFDHLFQAYIFLYETNLLPFYIILRSWYVFELVTFLILCLQEVFPMIGYIIL